MSKPGVSAVAIAVGADPEKKIVIIGFGGKVDRLEFTAEQAREFAKTIVGRSYIADGTMPVPEKMAAIEETTRVGDVSKTIRKEFNS